MWLPSRQVLATALLAPLLAATANEQRATLRLSECHLTAEEGSATIASSCELSTPQGDVDARFAKMQEEIDTLRAQLQAFNFSLAQSTLSVGTFHSCKEALSRGVTTSGILRINFGGFSHFDAYCQQTIAGGGWTLLLTVTNPTDDIPGDVGVSPFETNLNAGSPTLTQPYATVWNNQGVGLQPAVGDEFLLLRRSNNAWVRFVVGQWCGGADWHGYDQAACGSDGLDLLGLAHGSLYSDTNTLIGSDYHFHSCSHVGGCGSSGKGGDGVGFSTHESWLHGPNNAYGGAYDGSSGAHLYWAGVDLDPQGYGGDIFSYFYREKQ